MIVAIEGIDGSGKSSVCDELFQMIQFNSEYIRTPGGGIKEIRDIVLNPDNKIHNLSKLLMFLSEMIQISKKYNLYDPTKTKVTIFDRFYPSTFVYQVLMNSKDITEEQYDTIVDLFFNFMPKIDLTVVLTVDLETARKRSGKFLEYGKKDAFESAEMEVWEDRRSSYNILSECSIADMLGKFLYIDTSRRSVEETSSMILSEIKRMMK